VVESYVQAGRPACLPCTGSARWPEHMSHQATHASRAADRGTSTRAVLLAAAREVFMLEGYAQAGVTDIVALAGASVGSLYHHFAGKAELYLALYDQLQAEHDARTRKAVREIRDQGVRDPMRLLLAGARGYLDSCIEQRELVSMFVRGDGPPGFELVHRQRLSEWVQRNTGFFARSGEPFDEAAAVVLTGAMMLAAAEISLAPDVARARQLAEGVLEVLARLITPPASGSAPG